MNPKDIAAKKFEKGFGYKPEEVDEYLKEVAVALATAMKEKEESEAKIVKLVERINEYRNDEDAIRDALLIAQKQGNKIIAEAKEQAVAIVAEAQKKRDALLSEAANDCDALKRSEIEKIAVAIREENDKLNAVVAASKTQCDLQTEKLNKLKLEVTAFKKKLLGNFEDLIKSASALPELSDEDIKKIVSGQVRPAQPEPAPSQPADTADASSAQNELPKTAEAPKPAEEAPKKPVSFSDKSHSIPGLGFGEGGYKKQDYGFNELKFGQNQNKK